METITKEQIPRLYIGCNERVTVGNTVFRIDLEYDSDTPAPWDDGDGQGIVSDWTSRDKKPGEWVLIRDGSSKRFFDFAGSVKKAKEEQWGISDEGRAKLATKLGRDPTAKEITVAAVEQNFTWMKRWCNDQWCYVGVVVTVETCPDAPEKEGETESCWGFSSDDDEGLTEYAVDGFRELLRQIEEVASANRAKKTRMEAIASGILIKLIEADASDQLLAEYAELYQAAGVALSR